MQCQICIKAFSNQRALDRHKKIHQKLKYQCKVCTVIVSNRRDNILRHIRLLHADIPKNQLVDYIETIAEENEKNHQNIVEEMKNETEKKLETDNLKEPVPEKNLSIVERREDEAKKSEAPINNRVNVIQIIGNPNKNNRNQQQASSNKSSIAIDTTTTAATMEVKSIDVKKQKSESNSPILPPKKKASAKYNPIEHYRRILGLTDPNESLNKDERAIAQSEPVFIEHWRKRTSQNFLFKH
jgi:hypothetical protein